MVEHCKIGTSASTFLCLSMYAMKEQMCIVILGPCLLKLCTTDTGFSLWASIVSRQDRCCFWSEYSSSCFGHCLHCVPDVEARPCCFLAVRILFWQISSFSCPLLTWAWCVWAVGDNGFWNQYDGAVDVIMFEQADGSPRVARCFIYIHNFGVSSTFT